MIDRATIDKIMDAVNIVDVVGEFVNLRKAGVNYKGLCPFHDDKTPSFMVSPARQPAQSFRIGYLFVLHQEIDGIAALATGKTLTYLASR